jgi:hypothetical protein
VIAQAYFNFSFQNKGRRLKTKLELLVTEKPAVRTSFTDKTSKYQVPTWIRVPTNISTKFYLLPGNIIVVYFMYGFLVFAVRTVANAFRVLS